MICKLLFALISRVQLLITMKSRCNVAAMRYNINAIWINNVFQLQLGIVYKEGGRFSPLWIALLHRSESSLTTNYLEGATRIQVSRQFDLSLTLVELEARIAAAALKMRSQQTLQPKHLFVRCRFARVDWKVGRQSRPEVRSEDQRSACNGPKVQSWICFETRVEVRHLDHRSMNTSMESQELLSFNHTVINYLCYLFLLVSTFTGQNSQLCPWPWSNTAGDW